MPVPPATSSPPVTRNHSEVEVWTMEPNGWQFSSLNWFRETRLLPKSCIQSPQSKGNASFTLLQDRRLEGPLGIESDYSDNLSPALQEGCIVAVTVGGIPNESTVLWFGVIESVSKNLSKDGQTTGDVTAVEIGNILYRSNPLSFFKDLAIGGKPMDVPPLANIQTPKGIIGNAKNAEYLGSTLQVWKASNSESGVLFSRYGLLTHTLQKAIDGDIWPRMNVVGDIDGISDVSAPEVFNIAGKTIGQIIDYLVPLSRGLQWDIELNSEGRPQLRVSSYAQSALGNLPANGRQSSVSYFQGGFDDSRHIISLVQEDQRPFDRVRVVCGPMVFGVTLAYDHGFVAGWDSGNESYYGTAASGAADYGSLSDEDQNRRNQWVRQNSRAGDVFRRFEVEYDNGIVCSSNATSPDSQLACPALYRNGGSWELGLSSQITGEVDQAPPHSTMRLLDVVPVPFSSETDGNSNAGSIVSNQDSFAPVKVFRYQSGDDEPWLELTNPPQNSDGYSAYPVFSWQADSFGPYFRMGFPENEGLAENHWNNAYDSPWFDSGTTTANQEWVSDYEDLRVTVGIESAQRLVVTRDRPESGGAIQKIATIYRPDLYVAMARKGMIRSLDEDGSPDTFAADTVLHDDYDAADQICKEATGMLFRPASALTVTLAGADQLPLWASIGRMINTFSDDENAIESNTIVAGIQRTFDLNNPTTVITTRTVPALEIIGSGTGSSFGNGTGAGNPQISTSLKERGAEDDFKRDKTREIRPMVNPAPTSGGTVYTIRNIYGPESVTQGGETVNYIKYNALTAPTHVPTETPPLDINISTITSDNIGVGILASTNQRVYVAIRCQDTSGNIRFDWRQSLGEGMGGLLSRQTATLLATDTGNPVTVYLPWA